MMLEIRSKLGNAKTTSEIKTKMRMKVKTMRRRTMEMADGKKMKLRNPRISWQLRSKSKKKMVKLRIRRYLT
jgi:hypothetical protein